MGVYTFTMGVYTFTENVAQLAVDILFLPGQCLRCGRAVTALSGKTDSGRG
jgi:hypothetical protein